MRAWQVAELGEPSEVMEIVEVDDPTPGQGQVVIDVGAVGVSFPELLTIRGGYQVKPPLPFTPGNEVAGTVSAVGDGVTNLTVGDRVTFMGSGGLAEKTVASARSCFRLPDSIPMAKGCCLILNYGTTVFALDNRAKLAEGETLLVTAAAGGVGSAAIQIGKAMGANVIGLAGGPEKVQTVYELGADVAFDYREVDIVEAVRSATDGRGVDVVYEAVGGDIFQQVRRTVAWDGRLLIIGFTSGTIPDAPMNHALLKNYSIVGVHWGAWLARDPQNLEDNWNRIVELAATGHVDPLISEIRPFEAAAQALSDIGDRKTIGKVVIEPSPGSSAG
jgi:NADPH2:quinone reductase